MKKAFVSLSCFAALAVVSYSATLLTPIFGVDTEPTGLGTDHTRNTGDIAWVNPGHVLVDDGTYAHVALAPTEDSQYLWMTHFGFSVPSSATITGIEVKLNGHDSLTGGPVINYRYLVYNSALVAGTTITKSGRIFGSGTDVDVLQGSSSDLWGTTTLTPAIVNDSSFGTALVADFSASESGGYAAYTDYCEMTVYWSGGTPMHSQTRRAALVRQVK